MLCLEGRWRLPNIGHESCCESLSSVIVESSSIIVESSSVIVESSNVIVESSSVIVETSSVIVEYLVVSCCLLRGDRVGLRLRKGR